MSSKELLEGLQTIDSCLSADVSKLRDSTSHVDSMVQSILHASTIIMIYGDSLESQWAAYDSKMRYDKVDVSKQVSEDDEDDDRESFDPMEMKKSSIYRFFRKLERDITSPATLLLRRSFILFETIWPPISQSQRCLS